jgi:DNA-binding response OmpR family regulator
METGGKSDDSEPQGAERAPPRPLRVLIVDDNRDSLVTLGALCRSEGMDVQMLRRGEAVPAAVAQFVPDVILLDIGLPDRSGFDVAEELTESYGEHRPLLIAVTAYSSEEEREMARISGFHHFIAKPYDPQSLLRRLSLLKPKGPSRAGSR